MQIIFATPASEELADAAIYLEAQRPGSGEQFLKEVETALTYATQHPKIGKPVDGDVRRLIVKRFHYSLRYRFLETSQVIQVLRIAHSAQNIPTDTEDRK